MKAVSREANQMVQGDKSELPDEIKSLCQRAVNDSVYAISRGRFWDQWNETVLRTGAPGPKEPELAVDAKLPESTCGRVKVGAPKTLGAARGDSVPRTAAFSTPFLCGMAQEEEEEEEEEEPIPSYLKCLEASIKNAMAITDKDKRKKTLSGLKDTVIEFLKTTHSYSLRAGRLEERVSLANAVQTEGSLVNRLFKEPSRTFKPSPSRGRYKEVLALANDIFPPLRPTVGLYYSLSKS